MSNKTSQIIHTRMRDIVDPSHTALVVWDVQNLLVERIFKRETFLKSCRSLLDKARKSQIPIIYTKITPLPREYESPFRTYLFMKRFGVDDPEKVPQFLIPGTPEAEIHQDIFPQKGDPVLDKHTASIFIGTHFEQMMRVKGIQTLIFTGITTEIGIASSARDSANRGFYTLVVEDCVSSQDQEMHDYALKVLKRVCIVSSSQDLIKLWE